MQITLLPLQGAASATKARGPHSAFSADPWEEARGRGIDFRALGQEPGWFLEIDEGRSMHLVYDYMEREATAPAPARGAEGTTIVYHGSAAGRSLTVTVSARECRDVMSGFEFPSTVTVDIDGRLLHGCGRRLSGDE